MNERPLKIAFLVGKFPALSETFILDQITGLIEAGHEVDIFAHGHSSESIVQPQIAAYNLLARTHYFTAHLAGPARLWGGLKILIRMLKDQKFEIFRAFNVRVFGRQAANLRLLYMLHPLLQRGPYDILHCHFGPVGLDGLNLKKLGVPGKLIVTFHGHDISKYVNDEGSNVYEGMFEKADLLMPVSRYWKHRLIQLGADFKRVHVHHMGIDLAQYAFHPRSLNGANVTRLLTVGRLVEKKGVQFALRAIAQLKQRRPELKIIYNIIGSGDEEQYLMSLIAELGLEDCALLLGSKTRDEIKQHMLESHIFLLPSITSTNGDQEGIPVVIMEAMASGMPVLSTRHTGIPELVQEGVNGYLVQERDVAFLAIRLEQMIDESDQWAEMGRSARDFVETHYNIHKLNRQLIDIYQSLLSGSLEVSPVEGVTRKSTDAPLC